MSSTTLDKKAAAGADVSNSKLKITRSSSGYHRLRANADSLAFTQWMRFFFQKGTKDFGRLAEIWSPPENRSTEAMPFHPKFARPTGPTTTLEGLKVETTRLIQEKEFICDQYFEEEARRMHAGATGFRAHQGQPTMGPEEAVASVTQVPLSTSVLPDLNSTSPLRELSTADLAYQSALAKRDFDKIIRESDRRLKWIQVEERSYHDRRRRYEDLLKVHDQWIALLKESIDPHEASLLLSKRESFYEMLDELKSCCNSRCRIDMHSEWDRNWSKTEGVFPVDLMLWYDLRDRYFTVYDGSPSELEARLSDIFKRRFLAVVPWDESGREYAPLAIKLQSEKTSGENPMSTGELLENIEGIERAKAYDSEKVKKEPKMKAAEARSIGTSGKNLPPGERKSWCSHHQSASHSTEECDFLRKSKASGGSLPNSRKTKRGRDKADDGKRSGKRDKQPEEKRRPPKGTSQAADQIAALETAVKTLIAQMSPPGTTEEKQPRTVQILRTQTCKFYLQHLRDSDLTNNPVILDSGASRHVAPTGLEMTDLKEVSKSLVIIDAVDNTSKIQFSGSLSLDIAGKTVIFRDVLACEKVSNVLISCSAWLDNTDDRIILDDKHAWLQQAGSSDMHEIARAINGSYYMNPLKTLSNQRWELKRVVNAYQNGLQSPIRIESKVGTQPRMLYIEEKDLAEFSFPEFFIKPSYRKQSDLNVRVSMVKTTRKLTPTTENVRNHDAGLEVYLMEIHSRFGHASFRSILRTLQCCGVLNKNKFKREFNLLKSLNSNFPNTLEFCENCAKGKIARSPVHLSFDPATRILDRIHTDCVPIKTSRYHEKHGTYVIDGRSRYAEIKFHKTKAQTFDEIKHIISRWECAQYPLTVKAVRHDDGELKSQFAEYCFKRDPRITNETSPPYQKEFNGFCERNYKTVKGACITYLEQSKLPSSFTRFALSYAVYVKNRLQHPDDETTTPFRMWFKRDPDLSMLRPFGCRVTIHLPKEKRSGYYGSRGSSGIFLGYENNSLALVYDLATRRVVTTHDVVFHEKKFPGLTRQADDSDSSTGEDEGEVMDTEDETFISTPLEHPLPLRISGEDVVTRGNDRPLSNTLAEISEEETRNARENPEPDNLHRNLTFHEDPSDDVFDPSSEELTNDIDDTHSAFSEESLADSDEDNEKSIYPLMLETDDLSDVDEISTPSEENMSFEDVIPDSESTFVLSSDTQILLARLGINTILRSKVNRVRPQRPSTVKATTATHINDRFPEPMDRPPVGIVIPRRGLPEAPRSRKAMLLHPYREYFMGAEQRELNAMHRQGVWKVGDRVPGRKLLRPKWIYTYKYDKETETVARFKARLAVMGNTQTKDVDYDQTFSPVVKIVTLRIMLVIALMNDYVIEQADVDTAYLNAYLDRVNFMHMPEGYQEFSNAGRPLICLLLKSLYGLHQSGREWNKLITKTFVEGGFVQAKTDPCLFMKSSKDNKSFVLVYVDDLIIMAITAGEILEIKNYLKTHFSITELGDAKHFLGLQVERVDNGIFVGQPGYSKEILRDLDMENCKPRPTPMAVGWEHDPESPELSLERKKAYHSLVMKLAYLSHQTRPDLCYAVNTLSQHQTDSREHDWKALLHVMRYLRGTIDFGLFYTKDCNPFATLHTNDDLSDDTWFTPHAFADASHAQEVGRKSRSGHVIMMAGAAVSWFSKKQPVVSISSTEAEYYALSEAVKEILWVRQVFDEIGLPLNDPTVVHQDNQSTIAIAMNPIQHQRVKHMDVRVHFLRDHLDKGDVKLIWCPTGDMVADIFTKALPGPSHVKLTQLLGLRSLSILQGEATSPFPFEFRY